MPNINSISFLQYLILIRSVQLSATFVSIYDHLICFDQEVELIWKHPGVSAKIFFLLTRYGGNCIVITICLLLFTEVKTVSVSHSRLLLQVWATAIPSWVVQVIMQSRLYAMYGRSRRVLIFTGTCFVIEIIASMAFGLYRDLRAAPVRVFEKWTGCIVTNMPEYRVGMWLAIMAYEGILFLLALYKTLLHLLRMNHPWTRNSVADILLRDNILYFFVIFTNYCLTIVAWFALPFVWVEILGTFNITVTCTLGCRLILNIREVSYRHHQCVNTAEIEYQLRELADGPVLASSVDPAHSSAHGERVGDDDERDARGSRREVDVEAPSLPSPPS
ncbi:hypothetical protein JAAARDRAFT_320059 [Jaapia argillacea MUCL 33604]|uniref:DUF6533 domain-containing protein n=1 Tax=Jaapia argillacea MUCL 33604 TaxID=933084 RepID=A0A067Q0E2_9AGAM|nr:hypothetical protein JAAARDRAFT_320059 [Jaapia argillacea MUCL 33604]